MWMRRIRATLSFGLLIVAAAGCAAANDEGIGVVVSDEGEGSASSVDGDGGGDAATDGEDDPPTDEGIGPIVDVLDDGRPSSFWAITDTTYDLVRVDTLTGDIISNLGGYGQSSTDCGDDCGPLQALVSVEAGPDGNLWLTDCCEPAAGTIFRLAADARFDASTQTFSHGYVALPSPSGELLAVQTQTWVALRLPDGEDVAAYPAERADAAGSHTPLAWIDEETLVVRSSTFDGGQQLDQLLVLDLSVRSEPVVVGATIGGDTRRVDAAIRSDGMILALTVVPDRASANLPSELAEGKVSGEVFDPATGGLEAEFDLPDDVVTIDYDPSATFLITSGRDGVIRWYGAGASGELGSGFVAASW